MSMKEDRQKVIEILREIQLGLKVKKKRYNKFGGFNYRSCEDILEALKEIMPEGCCITLENFLHETTSGRIFIRAIATLHTPHGNIISQSFAEIPSCSKKKMDEAQATGAAISYAGKYVLGDLFLLDDGEDSDSLNDGKDQYTLEDAISELKALTTAKEIEEMLKRLKKENEIIYKKIHSKAAQKYKKLKEQEENNGN